MVDGEARAAAELCGRIFAALPEPGDAARWAASGAMALTGPADERPLFPPASLVPTVTAIERELSGLTAAAGRAVHVDALSLLGERAALSGLQRQGRCSCGGTTTLAAVADGWIAVALPRPDDWELLPAWLGTDDEVAPAVAGRSTRELVGAGAELGLAVAALGEVTAEQPPFAVSRVGVRSSVRSWSDVLVVDLSSLWAGPLCASLLSAAGARVVKVESTRRPDGARNGPRDFYDLLHAGQSSVALDFAAPAGRTRLKALLAAADVVVEASRPRALAQLGIDAVEIAGAGAVWLSITGYGRDAGHRVAFGDDAAVAGGLIAGSVEEPYFCADAVADPLTGLVGVVAVLDALLAGRSGLVDLSMARVAAWCARGPALLADVDFLDPAPPRARRPVGVASALGADTAAVLAELGVS